MTSEAAFISCPLSSHLTIQYLCLSVNLFTTLHPWSYFCFCFSHLYLLPCGFTSGKQNLIMGLPFCLHLFHFVPSGHASEQEKEDVGWFERLPAALFLFRLLCASLYGSETQKEKSPPSRAVEHKWMSATEDIFHMGRCISADFQSHSAYIPSLSPLLSREELESIFA